MGDPVRIQHLGYQ